MVNDWKVVEEAFNLEKNANNESLFTLANGYIGMRGDGAESIEEAFSKPGTFINGFFEKATIIYGESAYGFAKNKQIMLNVCNAKLLDITVDGETFNPASSLMDSYYRELDMKKGIEIRKLVWTTTTGKKLLIENRNVVSMSRKYVAAREYSITPLNFNGNINVTSILDANLPKANQPKEEETDDPRVEDGLGDGDFKVTGYEHIKEGDKTISVMSQATKKSELAVACAVNEVISEASKVSYQVEEMNREEKLFTIYSLHGKKDETIRIHKYISYVTSQLEYKTSYKEEAVRQALEAEKVGFEILLLEQFEYMKKFWDNADIVIHGNSELTQAIRFNLFQLLQSSGRDSATSIASKGLSGEGYGGHYFWESEAYIIPVFMFSDESIARQMLEYRYGILDKARENAVLLGHNKGALYSWRSIDGEEASAYFPAGSAQYHINADIAFAVTRYMDATCDMEFLYNCGLEMLLETARIWIDMGHYSDFKNGDFCIDCVTGPDEYTAIVNNNCYTNLMARENLWNGVKYAKLVKEQNPARYQEITAKIGLDESELEAFTKAADNMHIPYDETLQIHMQDDTFLQKKVLDINSIPKENFPLLLHYHPLFIYRHQVCKQPDLLLAQFYLPQYFSEEQKQRDYDYYEKLATHDSSLSVCIFSIMAAETKRVEQAYDYFMQCIRTDLDDMQKNTKDGLHMANMAGAWMSIVHGFAGLRAIDGTLNFKPLLPKEIEGYEFAVKYRGKKLKIHVSKEGITYKLLTKGNLSLQHFDIAFTITEGEKKYFPWN